MTKVVEGQLFEARAIVRLRIFKSTSAFVKKAYTLIAKHSHERDITDESLEDIHARIWLMAEGDIMIEDRHFAGKASHDLLWLSLSKTLNPPHRLISEDVLNIQDCLAKVK
jgi:hypothetical protein